MMTRTRVSIAALIALAAIAASAAPASAQETARIPVSAGSKLWIEGTSNLHGWSCKANQFDATVELEAAAALNVASAAPKALKHVTVRVPVKALKCGHGPMDDNLYKALNADDASAISYILGSFEPNGSAAKDSFTLNTVGTLQVAGRENKVSMAVEATRLADGTVKAVGSVPIKMTDYGIKPPTALFGRLKTGDDVTVKFELVVGVKAIAAAFPDR
jgi:polyisoprenoid-binding protein YceI